MVCLQLHFEPHGGAVKFFFGFFAVVPPSPEWSDQLIIEFKRYTRKPVWRPSRLSVCMRASKCIWWYEALDTRALHQVNLSLGLNPGSLLLCPESLPMCRGVHAFSQCPLQLHDPLSCVPHGILGSQKRKLGAWRFKGRGFGSKAAKSRKINVFSFSIVCS